MTIRRLRAVVRHCTTPKSPDPAPERSSTPNEVKQWQVLVDPEGTFAAACPCWMSYMDWRTRRSYREPC